MKARRITTTSLIGLAVCAVVIAVVLIYRQPSQPETSIVSESSLSKLSKSHPSGIDMSHLADGLTPPTNKWFSGLALQKIPQPVFSLPLSFKPSDNGFEINLPRITASAATIMGVHAPSLSVSINDASYYKVTRYDEIMVTVTYYDVSSQELGSVTIGSGLPYVFFVAKNDTHLTVHARAENNDKNNLVTTINNDAYHLSVSRGGSQNHSGNQVRQSLSSGGLATYYVVPKGQTDRLKEYADNLVAEAKIDYNVTDSAQTIIHYRTDNGKPTAVAALPHQSVTSGGMHYDSVYGRMTVIDKVQELQFSVPVVKAVSQLDMSKLTTEQRSELSAQLVRDRDTVVFADDTYAGGKDLYRAAQLLVIARQLGDSDTERVLRQKLYAALTTWLTPNHSSEAPRSFYFDDIVKGIVGVKPSFGSEQFNDHHFHYGYFIYAASILGMNDQNFVRQYAPMVNLLVADIANYTDGETLQLRRVYDPYSSHSWASGSAPFADGNNQESSSEAINAWTASSLWAEVIQNEQLSKQASWMLSSEMASTRAYWLSQPERQNYAHRIASLNWGGKRDYATFFSDSSAAKLAIQLIPLNPTQTVLSKNVITAQLAEAVPDGNYNVSLGDYLLMYKGLVDKEKALQLAKSQNDQYIDSANSRTYMLAWLMTR